MTDDTTRPTVWTRLARIRLPLIAGAVVAALVGIGIPLLISANATRSDSAASNHALVDRSSTSEVIGQVSTALTRVFSYDYTKPAVNTQAAAQSLSGDAASQYQTLLTALQKKAPGQQLTLNAKVAVAGVTSLRGNTAQLLVFLDQSSTRASDKQTSTSAAQLDITAVKHGNTWKVTELRPL